ncbi:TonB-dependent receptor [SAR92 clade bacterium H231]|nr:TonB-dependent receptor [SAR92 clade bacterium H231]
MQIPEDFFRWLVIFFVRPQQQSKPLFVSRLFDKEKIGKAVARIALAVAFSILPVSLSSADQPREQDFNIPQQSVKSALNSLATQANVFLLFPYDQVIEVNANPVVGVYSVQQALDLLLKNTGLNGDLTQGGVLAISRAGTNASATANNGKGKSMNTSKRKNVLATMVGLFATAGGVGSALGQGDEAATAQGRIDEIIVTANKREQSLQDTAMSISVISDNNIRGRNLVSMGDYLNSVPGVTFIDSGPGENQAIIRGIGLSQFEQATVSSYLGEVPLTYSVGGGSSTDMKLVDLARVEVLKGPQGTLYGSGAMGGTIRNIPNTPQLNQVEGKIDVGYGISSGSDDTNNRLVAVANLPLVDDALALRIAAYRFDTAGYIDRVSTSVIEDFAASRGLTVDSSKDLAGHTYTGGRASLLWQANSDLKITLMLATQELDEEGGSFIDVAEGGRRSVNFTGPEFNQEKIDISNLTLEYDAGWATFTGTYSHFEGESDRQNVAGDDFLGGTIISFSDNKEGDIVELRLNSQLDGSFQFIAGYYYEDFSRQGNQIGEWQGSIASIPAPSPPADLAGTSGPNGLPITYLFPISLTQDLNHKALFGELKYELTDQLAVTVGARWFDYDRRDNNLGNYFFGFFGDGDFSTSERDSNYKAHLSYTATEDALIYLQWAEGFRVGRGQSLPPASLCDIDNDGKLDFTNANLDPSVDSDRTTNYELGGKFTLMDRRLTINTAAYRVDWKDIPVTVFDNSAICPGELAVDTNAGAARSEGVEVEAIFHPIEQFQLSLSVSYMETEFLTDDLGGNKGNRLPLAPRVNGSVGMQYNFDVSGYSAFLHTDYTYLGDFMSDSAGWAPDSESYGKWNMRVQMDVNQWSFGIYGNNLTNRDAITVGFLPTTGRRLTPRMVGLDLSYSF